MMRLHAADYFLHPSSHFISPTPFPHVSLLTSPAPSPLPSPSLHCCHHFSISSDLCCSLLSFSSSLTTDDPQVSIRLIVTPSGPWGRPDCSMYVFVCVELKASSGLPQEIQFHSIKLHLVYI